jgi:dTDP-glucose 4,6-dehydratase
MKILVTGGCGFIGSNFILQQIKSSNQVLNIDKLTYAGNLENLKSIKNDSNYNFVNGDICDINFVASSINSFCPDVIIHFAAESHVDRSIEKPLDFVDTNINGTAILLQCAMEFWETTNSDLRFIHISTDEVFGSLGSKGFFNESTPYKPSSPYSASKASSDFLVRAWNKTFGFPAIITNCSNNYGPYQFPEKLIPLMIANCIDEKPLPVYGKGDNIRDWLFVTDHCEAINVVLKKGIIGQTYNIGGNNEIKNILIVQTICKTLDRLKPRSNNRSYSELITFVMDRPGHDFRYAIDSSKIKNELGWSAKETFETGIKKTIVWYLDNEKWWRNIQKGIYSQERLGLKVV